MKQRNRMVPFIAIIAGIVLSLGLEACAIAPESLYGYSVTEEKGFVDVMDKPDDNGEVLFRYHADVRVESLSGIVDGWAHVRVCNIDGYMKANQIDFNSALADAPHKLPVSIITGKTGSGEVNFRELPTYDIPPLGYYYVDKEVHVLRISDEWFHVNVDGRMGFIKSGFLIDTGQVTEYVIDPVQSPVRGVE